MLDAAKSMLLFKNNGAALVIDQLLFIDFGLHEILLICFFESLEENCQILLDLLRGFRVNLVGYFFGVFVIVSIQERLDKLLVFWMPIPIWKPLLNQLIVLIFQFFRDSLKIFVHVCEFDFL